MEPSGIAEGHGASSVRRRGTRKVVGIGCLIVLLAGGLIGFAIWRSQSTALPPLPEPNGYDDLVAAGRMISGEPEDVATASAETLQAFVDRHQAALERGRLGLTRECRVPVEFTAQQITDSINRSSQVRKLARLLSAEGRLAMLRQRPLEASGSYHDLVRLGYAAQQGGLIIDYLVGTACATPGVDGLRKLVPELPAAECGRLIEQLRAAESRAEPIAAVLEREVQFAKKAHGLLGRFVQITNPQLLGPAQAQAEQAAGRATSRLHLLLGHLALKMYHEANGQYPEELDALTPAFLETVPLDAFTGRPLVYRRDGDGYRLYSVGPDEKDDKGAPLSTSSPQNGPRQGDLVLEMEEPSSKVEAESNAGETDAQR